MVHPSQYQQLLADAVSIAAVSLSAQAGDAGGAVLQRPRSAAHGDFATPLPLALAKVLRQKPMDIAEQLHAALKGQLPDFVEASSVAAPGFINFTLAPQAKARVVAEVLEKGATYGRQPARKETLLLEFVSANPTGPLHVGHGRACAYGDALGNILEAVGITVEREYYVNDAGRQMDILAASAWLRHWQGADESEMPRGSYRGDYLRPVAARLATQLDAISAPSPTLLKEAADAESDDAAADLLVAAARTAAGSEEKFNGLRRQLGDLMLDEVIKKDMQALGVDTDGIKFFSENSLHTEGKVQAAVEILQQKDALYEKDGALWFRSSDYGDEKDRVVRRANGDLTYFAADIAYHQHKLARAYHGGHDYSLLNVLGADHHGYVPRVSAAVQALGHPAEKLQVEIIQFVALFEGGKRLKMSTRAGEFITLQQLVDEVGCEAARFYYLNRKNDQHLDFDLTAAKAQERKNPIYYLHYAHARICSVLEKWLHGLPSSHMERARAIPDTTPLADDDAAIRLCTALMQYPEVVEAAATERAPHLLTVYLHELAARVHNFYEQTRILSVDADGNSHTAVDNETLAQIALLTAAGRVLNNGATLLGLRLPKKM